jgi:hypothetical protein
VIDNNDEVEEGGSENIIEGRVAEYVPPRWVPQTGVSTETVFVETGRGNPVSVPVGSPFASTIEQLADRANYGGYFRVFVNGVEVLEPNPVKAAEMGLPIPPERFEPGMRTVITAYDKVGNQD